MKKYFNIAFIYAIAALAGGVFYREFTKFNGFSGVTLLGSVHVHFFALGTVMFLLVALFCDRMPLAEQKNFKLFMKLYNVGLPIMGVMMLVRGVVQVLGLNLSAAADGAISGIAGIGHILTGVGIVLLFMALKKAAKD